METNLNMTQFMFYESRKKNVVVAYLLGFFFFAFGLHYAYLKDYGNMALRLILTFWLFLTGAEPVISLITTLVFIFDGFYTAKVCREYNEDVLNAIRKMY